MSNPLLVIPTWNQLADPLPDGQLDPQRDNDCGFECCAMVAWACHAQRPNWSAGSIREMYRGWQGSGLTTAADLVAVLHDLDVPAHERIANVPTAMHEWNDALVDHKPVIALGRWISPSVLHWVLIVASPPGSTWLINDPWGGLRRVITDATVARLYAGQYVHVDVAAV